MNKNRKKRRSRPSGNSKAGRPRKDGARYANGRLKPQPPNELVVARRVAMMSYTDDEGVSRIGDVTKTTAPLDYALARGWITAATHRAGMTYAGIYRSCRLPRGSGVARLPEVLPGSSVSREAWNEMPASEVAAIFDRVFSMQAQSAEGDESAAIRKWSKVNGAMTGAQQSEVFSVCVMDSWPQWVIQRASGHFDTGWERKRALLVDGLDAVATVLRPVRQEPPLVAQASNDQARPVGRKVAETTIYTDQDGTPLYQAVVMRRV